MITTELRSEEGRTIVRKWADPAGADDRARLGREATMLVVARHPGVVELAAPPAAPDSDAPEPETGAGSAVELRTIFAGTRTLAAVDLDPLGALRALAAAAETLADLHGLGLVHGRVTADHVVLADSGRAVLCGFSDAGLAGERRGDGEVLVPSLDVAALGSLLTLHLDRAAADRPGGRRPSADLGVLFRLAARSTAADATLRPSARAFAVTLDGALPRSADASPVARRPIAVDPQPSVNPGAPSPATNVAESAGATPAPPSRPRVRRRLLAALGAMSALVSLGLGVIALADAPSRRGPRPSTTVDPGAELAGSAADGGSAPSDGAPTASHPSSSPRSSAGSPLAATSTDPDVEAAAQTGGDDVVIAGRRFALGSPDDQVLHAAWGCGRLDTPVLVRPDGAVFRFAAVAEPGQDVTGIPAGRLPPGAAAELVLDHRGCVALSALGPDGPVVLPIEPT